MDKIAFTLDDEQGTVDFYILEETRIGGTDYILVTDSPEDDEDAEALIMKDTSADGEEDAVFEIVTDDEELEAVMKVFENLLDEEVSLSL